MSQVAMVLDKLIRATELFPCVTYECSSDYLVSRVSSNSLELIGICPDNMVAGRKLWEERILPEDRDQLMSQLNQVKGAEIVSAVHELINDQGLHVSIGHGLRKVTTRRKESLYACMIPLMPKWFSTTISDGVVSQFIHKMGNHFQLINFLIGSLNQAASNVEGVSNLQLTVDRAVEFSRAFSHYSERPALVSLVSLGDSLHSAVKSLEPLLHETKVSLQYAVQESLNDAMITADAYLLELAFRALLQNALDATSDGDQIIVRSEWSNQSAREKSLVRIFITDTGCGMDQEMLGKAVYPFVTSKQDRDGLGLSTAKRIIEFHGGRLKISSAYGKWTSVEVLLRVERRAQSLATRS